MHYTKQGSVAVDGQAGTIFTATSDKRRPDWMAGSNKAAEIVSASRQTSFSGWSSSASVTTRWWRGCAVLEPATGE